MDNLKQIIAKNITLLRKENNITQLELAEKLNYSDKAVSKWERGESLPDIIVIKQIADLFKVKVDFLLEEHDVNTKKYKKFMLLKKSKNRKSITGVVIASVVFIVSLLFIICNVVGTSIPNNWLIFPYSAIVIEIILLILNSIWFNKRNNYIIISALAWTITANAFITILVINGTVLWQAFLLGIIVQIVIIFCSKIKP